MGSKAVWPRKGWKADASFWVQVDARLNCLGISVNLDQA